MADGYSSTERRANVRKQLRDRKGRWIEMGLKVRFSLNTAYATGTVTGIDTENDEVSVETPDGVTHKLGSKELESIGAKATLPAQEDRERSSENREDRNDRDLTREEIDTQLLDLELEEDVLREEGGNKERSREIQKERLELQKKRADLNTAEREQRDKDREGSKREKDEGSSGDKSPSVPNSGSDSSREKPAPSDGQEDKDRSGEKGTPDNGDKESSREKPGEGLPDLPGDGDDEHSAPSAPAVGTPNLPEQGDDETSVPRESIDILDIDRLIDGDIVYLVDPVNGPEDVTEFLREDGIWAGSNDFEDLELDPEALKDYIEARDPSDLLVTRSQSSGTQATVDIPVGTRVAFTLGGADGTGRIASVDTTTDTAEVSIAEGTVELPLDSLTIPAAVNPEAVDGPSDVYTAPATPISQQLPDTARSDSELLSADEQFAYNEARARLSVLLSRKNQAEVSEEVTSLEEFIDPLHDRAVAELSATLSPVDSAATSDEFPAANDTIASAPIDGTTDLSAQAAELYGPDDAAISSINADLRAGYADADILALQDLVLRSEITENSSLFRGEYISIEIAAQIAPGGALRNDSFMSTRKSAAAVDEQLARVTPEDTLVGKIPVSFRIEADAGAPAVDLSAQTGHPQEVLLPAGVELVVTDVGWDEERGKLSVTASYDGTSVASVADLTALEENPLKSADTTIEDLTNALQQTNDEVNKHQFNLVAAQIQDPEADFAEDERKLARARAVRDSITALIATQGGNESTAPKKITDASAAAELAQTVTGDSPDEQAMRSALQSIADVPGAAAYVVQRDGEVSAAAATVDSREAGVDDYVWIGYLGALDDDDGAAVLDLILEDAAARNRGVLLEPTPNTEDYWLQEQGFVEDPLNSGASANGLDAAALKQRVDEVRPDAEPVPAHSGGMDPEGGTGPEPAIAPGSEIRDIQDLADLPAQAWVGLSSATGPTELYQKDEDGYWADATSSADDPVLTGEELFGLASGTDTTIWFEEVSEGTPEIESTPVENTSRISEGDHVSTSDGEVSGVVESVEEDGKHVLVRDSEGVTHRFPSGFLTSPNPNPMPNPQPNPMPAPGIGEGVGTPNSSDLRQRDENEQPFASDGSGLALYVGYEAATSDLEPIFGIITALDEDGEHVYFTSEDDSKRRIRAEDLDLVISVEAETE